MRRALHVASSLAVAALALPASATAAARGEWISGDLHLHTTYSHDSYGGPGDDNTDLEDGYTAGHTVGSQFAVAASRGLDFIAITDHNDVRSQADPGFGAGGVIAVPGYENSLKGHAQMLGATRLYDNGDSSAAAVQALARALRADGGIFQVNHPSDPAWEYGYDVRPETVEAWNLPWYYQPPFPSASDNDRALRYWEGWLDRGKRVAVTGGSDNHWVSTTAVQGAGQPTTWVFVRQRSVRGILEGLRAGHTSVSHQPPGLGGPRLILKADGDRTREFEAMAGDAVPPRTQMKVRVKGAAPGAFVRVVTDGGTEAFAPVTVTGSLFTHRFRAPAGATWVRAEVYGEDAGEGRPEGCSLLFGGDNAFETTYCTNRVAMLALSSPIYVR